MYWISRIGNGAGPLILTWVNEICSDDMEKRALLVAAGNDLAYVVQAVAPNFVWKTTDFPYARRGYLWSVVLQILLGKSSFCFIFRGFVEASRHPGVYISSSHIPYFPSFCVSFTFPLLDVFCADTDSLLLVFLTFTIQLLLWRDEKRVARTKNVEIVQDLSEGSESPILDGGEIDGKKVVRTMSSEVIFSRR